MQYQQALGERELKAILYAHPVAMVLYGEHVKRFVATNAAACRMFECSHSQLLSLGLSDVFADSAAILAFNRSLKEADAGSGEHPRAVRIALQSGRRVHVDVYGYRFHLDTEPVVALILVDVTERVVALEQMQQQFELVRQLYINSPDPIVELDLNDRVRSINPAFSRLFGYSEAELVGQRLQDLIVAGDDREESFELNARVLREGNVAHEAVRLNRDGEPITCVITGYPIMRDGVVVGLYGVYKDIRDLAEEREALEHLATRDHLTELHNRRHFEELCEETIAQRQRAVLLFIDLDDFKPINDTFGHQAGDLTLQALAACFTRAVRVNDEVARIGGDEFAVLLRDCTRSEAEDVAKKLIRRVEALSRRLPGLVGASEPVNIGVSIGISEWNARMESLDAWMKRADEACYEAKSRGKNRYVIAA